METFKVEMNADEAQLILAGLTILGNQTANKATKALSNGTMTDEMSADSIRTLETLMQLMERIEKTGKLEEPENIPVDESLEALLRLIGMVTQPCGDPDCLIHGK